MQLFERIKVVSKELAGSETRLASMLTLTQSKFNFYMKEGSQKNLWDYLPKILELFPSIRREWLWWGEGEMLKESEETLSLPQRIEPQKIASVPVLGFASCGVIGWSGEMTIPMAAAAPHVTPRTIAVMASGESMIPAGIGHGHICFCEPDLEPLRGDIVYVRRKDELGTLKTFLGWGMEAGIPEATKGELCLRGWSDRDESGRQRELIITVDRILIKTVAPVVFVRRRM